MTRGICGNNIICTKKLNKLSGRTRIKNDTFTATVGVSMITCEQPVKLKLMEINWWDFVQIN